MAARCVLYSKLAPEAVADALRRSIGKERRSVLSPSAYEGNAPLLGEVRGNTFRVQKGRDYRNSFAPHFYGTFLPDQGGTRIEGHFETPRCVKYFTRLWLGGVGLLGGIIFVATVADMMTKPSQSTAGEHVVALVVPLALALFGVVLPKVGRLIATPEEAFILERLRKILAAHTVG